MFVGFESCCLFVFFYLINMWYHPQKYVNSLYSPCIVSSRERKCVCLLSLKGDFTLNAIMATDISDLVAMFLAGLLQRSQYAVTLQEVNRQGQKRKYAVYIFFIWLFMIYDLTCFCLMSNGFHVFKMIKHFSASRRRSSSTSLRMMSFLLPAAGWRVRMSGQEKLVQSQQMLSWFFQLLRSRKMKSWWELEWFFPAFLFSMEFKDL